MLDFSYFFVTLSWIAFFLIIIFYSIYFILLFYFNRKAHLKKPKLKFTYPKVSLIVPVYNEEKIVEKKIKNIEELDYPSDELEVIFIDGNSSDKTAEIIEERSKKSDKLIRLIRQDHRDGYTRAVTLGILNSKNEIIVATDGASFHYPDALLHLVKHFVNPNVGAVTGKEVVLSKECGVGPQLEKSYRFFYDFMRIAESEMDSTPDSKGEILAVRKEICTSLLVNLDKSPNASFDSCVPYQARLMGFRTIYDEEAKYYECAPSSFTDRMKQQIRRATLLMGAMFLFKNLIFDRKAGKFGLIILPFHFVMYCLIPSIFVICIISIIFSTFLNLFAVVPLWIIGILLIVASKKSRTFLFSFIQSQFALIIAIFKLAKREESLFIDTIPSTRESV